MIGLSDLKFAALYLVVWCALDYVGFLFEVAPGISPWYPPHGWSVAFLLMFGLKFWPLLLVGPLIMGSLIWLKGEFLALAMISICICCGYSLAALAMQRLQFNRTMKTMRDASILLSVGVVSSFLVALASILSLAVNGLVEWPEFMAAFFAFWAGDTLGVICLAPFFLVNCLPVLRRVHSPAQGESSLEPLVRSKRLLAGQCALAVLCLFTLVGVWGDFANPPLYLLFVPAVWIALTQSIALCTIALAAIPISAVAFLRSFETQIPVADVQLFIAAFSAMVICIAALAAERRFFLRSLERHVGQLERSNANLERFAHAASHDLQQPLRTISGFVDLLSDRWTNKTDETDDEYFGFIKRGVHDAQNMIADILDFSRIKQDAERHVETDIEAALSKAAENLQALIESRQGAVTNDPLPTLRVSNTQIVRLFQNLIQNAVTFRSDRPPEIHVTAVRQLDEWMFRVQDNGVGIDPYLADDAFLPFKRYHSADSHTGSGLGLSICREIVESHGGRIGIDKDYVGGTSIYFTLPNAT